MNVESDGTDNDACIATATYTPGEDAIASVPETVTDENGDSVMEKYLVMQVATGNPKY